MDSKRIEILLSRYWSCVSTLEEEKELRDYFSNNEVADDMKEVAALFQYYQAEKKIDTLDGSFDDSVIDSISEQETPPVKSRKRFYNYLKVAATLLIVITASS